MDLISTAKALDEFDELELRDERSQTFVEVAGFPKRENVLSNILAFFLDPEESHGLGTLMLDALADAGNRSFGDSRIGSNVSVQREVSTTERKRPDILIESSDYAILIEHKTVKNARVENPLDSYASYLNNISNSRSMEKILLTVTPSSAGTEYGFQNVIHTELIYSVRSRLGHYLSEFNARWLTMLLDFLNTLENLTEGTRMDRKLISFLAGRQDELVALMHRVEEFNKECETKGKELRNLVSVENYENVKQSFYCDRKELFCDLLHDIKISDTLTIQLEASIFPRGWQIWMWPHGGDEKPTDSAEMRTLIDQLKIPANEYYDEGFLHCLSYDHKENEEVLRYDEDVARVAQIIQDLIERLATEGTKVS